MKKYMKLNLGCGNKKIDGYTGVDFIKTAGTDIVHNLNSLPYPFTDSSIEEIIVNNVLEHLDDLIAVMEELHRILKADGILKINVPYAKSDGAFKDPTHKHFFTEKTFQYFTDDYEYNYYSKARFEIKEIKFITWSNRLGQKVRNLIPFRAFFKYFLLNMYDELYFELRCVK